MLAGATLDGVPENLALGVGLIGSPLSGIFAFPAVMPDGIPTRQSPGRSRVAAGFLLTFLISQYNHLF